MADLGDRRTYLGATDIAAIVGLSPWATPLDVYRQKVEGLEVEVTDNMEAGLILEPAIVEMYERQTKRRTFVRNEIVHPDYPFLRFHPDRLTYNEPGVFDAKATWQRSGGKYGEPGTDQVPAHVRVQMVLYCGATRRQWADVGLLRRPPLSLYRVPADPELYEWLIDEAVKFWHGNVVAQVPPPIDASESYRQYLAEQHPLSEDIELIATPEQQLMVAELRQAKAEQRRADEHYGLLQNRLIKAMGDAAVLRAPDAVITYRNTKPSPKWKDIAERIGRVASLDVEEYRLADVAGRIGSRRFLPTFEGEEEFEEAAA